MFETNLSSDTFDYCHFNEFRKLDGIERYSMMSSITTLALATACCYIDEKSHLDEIINFMAASQQFMFKRRLDAVKLFNPNTQLVIEVQQMIMQVHHQSRQATSLLTTMAEMVGVTFDESLDKQSDVEKQFSQSEFDTSDTAPLFSLAKLQEEIKHRKEKDIAKLKALIEIGANKQHCYASDSKLIALNKLAVAYPNFTEALAQVTAACQVSILTNSPLSLPAVNLQGPPGIGKTQFIKALAKTLHLEFFSINAAAMTGRFELSGGNPQYMDADVGMIGQVMCYEAKSFQPILLIDELCMARDNQHDSIIQPLYSFLDREQRKYFKENFLNLELDLSGAIIFTTTNDYKQLKPALKSRLVNIDIKAPSPKQMQSIVQNIYESCLLDMKLQHYFNARLSNELLSKLSFLPPRKVIEALRLAIGKACVRANTGKRVELVVEDFEALSVTDRAKNETITTSNIH